MTEPTGIEWPEEDRFRSQRRDSKISGGSGYDYVMGAFPLAKLGLKKGATGYFSFGLEAGSHKYSHAAVDKLGGSGKNAATIKWVIGSNKYEIIETDNNGNI